MTEKFDEFMEDVEQDIRQEKYQELWRKYGKTTIVVLVSILLAVSGYTLWTYTQERNRESAADQFMTLQELVDTQEYDKALSVADLLSHKAIYPYDVFSHLMKAALLLEQQTAEATEQALDLYKKLEADGQLPQFFKELVTYKRLNAQLQQPNPDLESLYIEIQQLLQADSVLLPLVQELEAIVLMQQGQSAQAVEAFMKVAQNNAASEDLRARAQLMSQYLGSKS